MGEEVDVVADGRVFDSSDIQPLVVLYQAIHRCEHGPNALVRTLSVHMYTMPIPLGSYGLHPDFDVKKCLTKTPMVPVFLRANCTFAADRLKSFDVLESVVESLQLIDSVTPFGWVYT